MLSAPLHYFVPANRNAVALFGFQKQVSPLLLKLKSSETGEEKVKHHNAVLRVTDTSVGTSHVISRCYMLLLLL